MKRLLLLLSFCFFFTLPARADDDVTSIQYGSTSGLFTALLKGLGSKFIPDYQSGSYTPTMTAAGGGSIGSQSNTVYWSHIGKTLTMNGVVQGTASGTVSSVSIPLPNSYSVPGYCRAEADQWANGYLTSAQISPGGTTLGFTLINTSLAGTNFPAVAGGAGFSITCITN